jgi:hypothetical protein
MSSLSPDKVLRTREWSPFGPRKQKNATPEIDVALITCNTSIYYRGGGTRTRGLVVPNDAR